MSQNAGGIYYDIEMDVQGLLVAQQRVNQRLDLMERGFDSTTRSIINTERSMSSLSGVASALSAAIAVKQVAEYGNAWVTVSNKLANSLRASEQLADVTQRVFDISQNTRAGLEATASLYGRLERATRSAGTSTEDLITLTETVNKGLAVSGATSEEASSTMIQLSQALASGVLRGEEFNSISENGSRLAVALADSLGVTIGQLRAMAAQGKLTTDVVVDGLLKQSDTIAKEFGNTTLTMGQAFTVASNNVTKFVGESSSANTSIRVFNDGIISLSDNFNVIANVVGAAAVIFGGRLAGALALATKSRIDDALAAKAQTAATAQNAAATANAARVAAIKAGLDKEQALSNLAVAQTEYNVARGTAAEALALENLVAVKSVAIQRSATYAEAQLAEAAATRAATAASAAATTTIGGLARGALSLVGGPAGAAVIAAAGIFYLYQRIQQAKQESIEFADKLDGVIAKMKSMSQVQLAAQIDSATKSIKSQADAIKDNESSIKSNELQQYRLRRTMSFLQEGSLLYNVTLSELSDAQSEHTQLLAQNETALNKLSQTVSKTGILRAQMNGTFSQGIDLLKRDGHEAGVTAGLMNQLGTALDFAGRAKDRFNATSLIVTRPKDIQDYLDGQQDQIELQSELNHRKREQLKAEMDIRSLAKKGGDSDADQIERDVKLARERAGVSYDQKKADEDRRKEQQKGEQQDKKSASSAESVAQKLANLKQQSELTADSTREMSREQAILTAQQSLGSTATQKDLQLAAQYAAKKWDGAAAIRAQVAAQKLIPESAENASYEQDVSDLNVALTQKKITQEQYNAASEQMELEHQVRLSKIRAQQATANPLAEARAEIDPVTALANQNAQKLALMKQYYQQEQAALTAARQQNAITETQYQQQKLATDGQYQALINAQNAQYEQQRTDALWAILSQQSLGYDMLTGAVDAFAGNASNAMTGLITGSMSASEALRSLGSTMLNSVVNSLVQVGVEALKNYVIGQTIGTASVAAGVSQAAALSAAWATPAALASLASFGANAAPAQAGMTATVGLGNTLALAGARKNGGPVSAGSMYQVGEGGRPEIYRASTGKQYMIPGDNGSVLSNKDISGKGGITVINQIENYSSGAMVDTQASSDSNGNITIQTIITDIANGGQIGQAIANYHNAPRRARG